MTWEDELTLLTNRHDSRMTTQAQGDTARRSLASGFLTNAVLPALEEFATFFEDSERTAEVVSGLPDELSASIEITQDATVELLYEVSFDAAFQPFATVSGQTIGLNPNGLSLDALTTEDVLRSALAFYRAVLR